MKRKKRLLLILVVLLLGALYYAYLTTPMSRRVERSGVTGTVDRDGPAAGLARSPGQDLLLDRLERQGTTAPKVERDIFNFYRKPVAARPAPKPEPVEPPPPPPPPSPVVEPPPPPTIPPARISYLGLLEKSGDKRFFLASDDEIFVVRPGEEFGDQNRFQVKSFDGEKLVISRGAGLPDAILEVADTAPNLARQQGGISVSPPDPGDEVPERPRNLPRLKSFKIRDPSAAGQ